MRTRGWWTVEPSKVLETVEAHGELVLGSSGEWMVEFTDQKAVDALSASLAERFADQVLLAPQQERFRGLGLRAPRYDPTGRVLSSPFKSSRCGLLILSIFLD